MGNVVYNPKNRHSLENFKNLNYLKNLEGILQNILRKCKNNR